MDHRMSFVRVALAARLDTRLAANAPIRVDEEVFFSGHVESLPSYCCGSRWEMYSGGPAAFRTRTAQTLYSGIFEIGSCAAIVSRLMLFGPAQ
jgi:hypothetical protein